MNTLWGTAQSKTEIVPHVWWVSTAGHGGIMIAKATAERELTPQAVTRGVVYGGYLCYEEDCLYALIAFEKPQWFMGKPFNPITTVADIQQTAFENISAWNADYLIERGIKPETESYKYFCFRRDEDAMRKARDPRLIVSASRINDTKTRVWTADGKEHIVAGYGVRQPDGKQNLLEYCEIVS